MPEVRIPIKLINGSQRELNDLPVEQKEIVVKSHWNDNSLLQLSSNGKDFAVIDKMDLINAIYTTTEERRKV